MPETWREALSRGTTWVLGVIFVAFITVASADRVSVGEAIQANTNRITRLEELTDNVEGKLTTIEAKIDRMLECQTRIQLDLTC